MNHHPIAFGNLASIRLLWPGNGQIRSETFRFCRWLKSINFQNAFRLDYQASVSPQRAGYAQEPQQLWQPPTTWLGATTPKQGRTVSFTPSGRCSVRFQQFTEHGFNIGGGMKVPSRYYLSDGGGWLP